MKDIDFDELDRAVASALGTVPPSSAPSHESQSSATTPGSTSEPAEVSSEPAAAGDYHETPAPRGATADFARPTVERSGAASPLGRRTIVRRRDDADVSPTQEIPPPARDAAISNSPSATSALENASSDPQPTSAPRKRIIPHRSGRAMDVIAGTGGAAGLKPKRPVSRTATTVSPIDSTGSENATSAPVIADVLPAADDEVTVPAIESTPELTMAPEIGGDAPADTLPGAESPEIASFDPVPYETDLTTFDETTAKELEQSLPPDPAVSPFITDAKVEKRPLGGLEPSTVAPADMDTASLDDVGAMREEVVAPAELDRDIVAIESKEVEIPEPHTSVRQSPVVSPAQPVRTPAPAPAGPAAIPRQYKEVPRVASEDDEAGAIFDPQTYHVAPDSPEKRSFGWGWFIAIVSIILLLAVAAALAWMEGVLPIPL